MHELGNGTVADKDAVVPWTVQDGYEKETTGKSMDTESTLYIYIYTAWSKLFGKRYQMIRSDLTYFW
jgi:hypothetical protein